MLWKYILYCLDNENCCLNTPIKHPLNHSNSVKIAKYHDIRKNLGKEHTNEVNYLSRLFLELKFVKLEFGVELEFQSILVHTTWNSSLSNSNSNPNLSSKNRLFN